MVDSNNPPNLTKEQIDSVLTLYSAGKFNEAITQIKILNKAYPNVPLLFNIAGACYKGLRQLERSIKMFQTAIDIKSDYAEAHKNLGITLKEIGKLHDAVNSLDKAIMIDFKYIVAIYNRAIIYKDLGKMEEAVSDYQAIIKLKPEFKEAHNNLGNIYSDLDEYKDAIKCYQKAIAIEPNFAEAHNNLGNVYKDLDEYKDAIKCYQKAIAIEPNFAEAQFNLGIINKQKRKIEVSINYFKCAIALQPNFAEAHNNLGISFTLLGKIRKGIKCYEKVISINPDSEEAYKNLGFNLMTIGKVEAARKCFEKAIEINPNYAEAHKNLGNIYKKKKQFDKAMLLYNKTYELKPDLEFILGDVLNNKMNLCDWSNLTKHLKDLRNKIIRNKKAIGPFSLLGMLDDPALHKLASEIFSNFYYPRDNSLEKIKTFSNHTKIRIGYFSSDFKVHPVGFLTAELYELHDRECFEIHAFSLGPDTKDEVNLRIKAGVDYFHAVEQMSHKEIVLLARSIEIDIAVDLGGFTAKSRTDVFAMSVAPIQLSYIGFLGTMGADYYDYLIADPIMIPKESQKHYVEKIIYLPSFQVNDSKDLPPDISMTRKDVGLPEEGFVFCCFNNTYKFTPTIFDSWARILKRVEGSVLIVYANNQLQMTNLTKEIIKRGVAPERLVFGERLNRSEYLARYRVADLFLDTHPYNAGTTASDALKMGLPMLTMIGKSYQARMGASIVNAVNLPELITNSPKEYEALAIKLGNNPDKIKAIKEKLKANLSTAPLFDTKLFTKNIESAFTQMYERNQKGLETDHIY